MRSKGSSAHTPPRITASHSNGVILTDPRRSARGAMASRGSILAARAQRTLAERWVSYDEKDQVAQGDLARLEQRRDRVVKT